MGRGEGGGGGGAQINETDRFNVKLRFLSLD